MASEMVDIQTRRRIRRTALMLALLAVAVLVGFYIAVKYDRFSPNRAQAAVFLEINSGNCAWS